MTFGLPQIYREREVSFVFFSNEGYEPPHIHAVRGHGPGGASAKFWLAPLALCWNRGFNSNEMRWIQKTLNKRREFFLEQWHAKKTHQS